jgi:hypothetical protein
VSLPTALELCRLGLGTLIDIRQTFEIEMKGAIPDTVHIPLFEVKRMLGHALSEDEQDILDAGKPKDMDVMSFFTMINQLHHGRDHLLLCICNSASSLAAAACCARWAMSKALSVAGLPGLVPHFLRYPSGRRMKIRFHFHGSARRLPSL